jgi:hypothetical protein
MSIIADIKQAKGAYIDHVARHKCRDAFSTRADGGEPCAVRAELIQAWSGTAGMWAKEPDDDQRQRDHYNRNLRPVAAL